MLDIPTEQLPIPPPSPHRLSSSSVSSGNFSSSSRKLNHVSHFNATSTKFQAIQPSDRLFRNKTIGQCHGSQSVHPRFPTRSETSDTLPQNPSFKAAPGIPIRHLHRKVRLRNGKPLQRIRYPVAGRLVSSNLPNVLSCPTELGVD